MLLSEHVSLGFQEYTKVAPNEMDVATCASSCLIDKFLIARAARKGQLVALEGVSPQATVAELQASIEKAIDLTFWW